MHELFLSGMSFLRTSICQTFWVRASLPDHETKDTYDTEFGSNYHIPWSLPIRFFVFCFCFCFFFKSGFSHVTGEIRRFLIWPTFFLKISNFELKFLFFHPALRRRFHLHCTMRDLPHVDRPH